MLTTKNKAPVHSERTIYRAPVILLLACALGGCGKLDQEKARKVILAMGESPPVVKCEVPKAFADVYEKDRRIDGKDAFCVPKKPEAAACASAMIAGGFATEAPPGYMKDIATRGESVEEYMARVRSGAKKFEHRDDVYASCWTWNQDSTGYERREGSRTESYRWVRCGTMDDVEVTKLEQTADDLARVHYRRKLVLDPKLKELENSCGSLIPPATREMELVLTKQGGDWVASKPGK